MGRARIIADLVGFSTDSGVLNFGADKEITLTHDPDDGLILKHAATADDSFPELTFQTGDTDIAVNDLLGRINFQAPDEGAGTDAILVAGAIAAISEGDFSSSANATSLIFQTGASETATTKMTLSSGGNLDVTGVISGAGFTAGSAVLAEAELELLDGLTAGTAIASKVVTTDANIDSTGMRNLTISGEIDAATGDFSGVVDVAGATTTAAITASGIIKTDDTTAATSTTDGSLQTDGGLSVAADAVIGDDLLLLSDAAVLNFGADSEIKLTHVHNTGLLLTDSGGTPTLQFHDANESISSDGGHLIFTSNGVAFDFPSADGSDGQVLKTDGSGVLSFVTASANTPSSADGQALGSASLEWSDLFLADGSTIQFGNDQEVILTHVADVGLKLSHEATGDNLPIVLNLESEEDAIVSGEEIGRIDFTAGDSGGTDAILTAASIAATAEDTFAADNNSTGLAFKLGVSAAATEMFRMTHDGDFKIITDGSALGFGADNEIELTHVHNTGLLLTDSGGSPTLQLHDSNESVSSDGTNLFLTSGGTAFTVPASDGSNGQFLKTNGSGVLAFDTVSTVGAFNAFEYTATAAQTSFSGSDDNSNTLAYTASVNNVFVTVNGVMLDGSDYTATNGTAVVLSAAAAANDIIKILATNASSITTADLDGAEFVLDADGDTSIRANTDDQIDFKLGNAIDITMGVNAMNILSGTTLTIDSGATITNSGTANGFGLSTGKAIVLAMLFGR